MLVATMTTSGVPIDNIVNELKNFEISIYGYVERVALIARSLILERLETHFGDSAGRFDVGIRPMGQLGYTVMVGPKDEVGVFLLEGTAPHVITSSIPMPVGGGNFATVVHHPGFEGKEEIFQRAIYEGLMLALEMANV